MRRAEYRYLLTRRLHPVLGEPDRRLLFCMLNPSTADEENDDPTIRRCIGFAERERCSNLVVVNLFGARATKPKDLLYVDDPVGPGNDAVIRQEAARADLIIAAWGDPPPKLHSTCQRPRDVLQMLLQHRDVYRLGEDTTAIGNPRHPLFRRGNAPLVVHANRLPD